MSGRPKDWAISASEARGLELASMQQMSDENRALRAELEAMTAEKEKWRIRCAEETTAWADEAARTRRLHSEKEMAEAWGAYYRAGMSCEEVQAFKAGWHAAIEAPERAS